MTIERLYKYGSLNEHSEELFSTPKIWLSRPSELNDPFECRPKFTYDGTKEQIIEFHSRIIQARDPLIQPHEITAETEAIYLRGLHQDAQVLDKLRDIFNKTVEMEIGLYCMSEVRDSILIWSHYAHNHEGYCLEFEATDNTPVFGEALKVEYRDDYPIIEYFNTSNEKKVDLTFLRKYTGWSYEKEWRLIDPTKGAGWLEYPPELLKGVIFGVRMPEDKKVKIREWVGLRGHAVQFYQAVQNDQRYAIEVQEIP